MKKSVRRKKNPGIHDRSHGIGSFILSLDSAKRRELSTLELITSFSLQQQNLTKIFRRGNSRWFLLTIKGTHPGSARPLETLCVHFFLMAAC